MCDAPAERRRRNPPPTPRMRRLLAAMAATSEPVIWDYLSRRMDVYTLGTERVPGAAVTGLSWRGLLHGESARRGAIAYGLTDAGRRAAKGDG
jgi:hypothetical protein